MFSEALAHISKNLVYDLLPAPGQVSRKWHLINCMTIGIVGNFFKLLMKRHQVTLHHSDRWDKIVQMRLDKQPLITVANHTSNWDDVCMWGHLVPIKTLFNDEFMRYTPAAVDICFTRSFHSYFFACGKSVPIWRRTRDRFTGQVIHKGEGVYQPTMQFLLGHLALGAWVHLYPQGRVVFPEERLKEKDMRLRWGVGRLVADAEKTPLVIPIWHCGMDDVNPSRQPYAWHAFLSYIKGTKVTICIGEPLDLAPLLKRFRDSGLSPKCIREQLTTHIQDSLYTLKDYTEKLHEKGRTVTKGKV